MSLEHYQPVLYFGLQIGQLLVNIRNFSRIWKLTLIESGVTWKCREGLFTKIFRVDYFHTKVEIVPGIQLPRKITVKIWHCHGRAGKDGTRHTQKFICSWGRPRISPLLSFPFAGSKKFNSVFPAWVYCSPFPSLVFFFKEKFPTFELSKRYFLGVPAPKLMMNLNAHYFRRCVLKLELQVGVHKFVIIITVSDIVHIRSLYRNYTVYIEGNKKARSWISVRPTRYRSYNITKVCDIRLLASP